MKFRAWLQAVFLLTLISLLVPTTSFATSWISLSPSNVLHSAEVIVLGTYDFANSDGKMTSDGQWTLYKFKVEKYIRGSGDDNFNVGIATGAYDLQWAKGFQGKRGELLLFLQKNGPSDNLLIPVSGPHGMIKYLDGKIEDQSSDDASFYYDVLKSRDPKPNVPTEDETIPPSKFHWYWVTSGVLMLGTLSLIYWKLIRKNKL